MRLASPTPRTSTTEDGSVQVGRLLHRVILGLIAVLAIAPGATAGGGDTAVRLALEHRAADVEILTEALSPKPLRLVSLLPRTSGTLWFGVIHRRLPEDAMTTSAHDVPFVVRYEAERPVEVWIDVNFNGNLSEEHPVGLTDAGDYATCSCNLAWEVEVAGETRAIEWTMRLRFDRVLAPGVPPIYRVQQVLVPAGTISWGGDSLVAFAYDGNHDGLYTREYGDGIFIDLDKDGFFRVELMSPEFLPFSVPARFGRHTAEVSQVSVDGTEISVKLRDEGTAMPRPEPGKPAPPFEVRTTDGRVLRNSDFLGRPLALYFWASWCPSCRGLAPQVEDLYSRYHGRGFEIIGISYDDDSTALADYLRLRPEPWPQVFEGRRYWENSMGRLFLAHAAGAAFLIDSEGSLDGVYYDIGTLEGRIQEMVAITRRQPEPARSASAKATGTDAR
ncbi:MAG TPA: TlpA disulfide reductase family protein [Candidatus Eisenbacteria bacterium]|nr:TlpA disulfide reductase family protein [Candidatus Eisenbacteria bacterium]